MDEYTIKIRKTSKVVSMVAKVGRVSIYIIIVILTVALVSSVVSGGDLSSFQVGDKTIINPLAYNDGYVVEGMLDMPRVPLEAFNAIISAAIIAAMLFFVSKLFDNIGRSYTPFEKRNVEYIKTIAWLMAAFTIIPPSVSQVISIAFNSEAVFNYELALVVITFIFFSLSEIFAYGVALQGQADETL